MKKLYSDGGARGNPGPAAFGVVLYDEKDKIIFQGAEYLGKKTNNQAEYAGLIFGLEKALELGVEELTCFLDSELIVKQVNGEYKVKNKDLAKLYLKVWNLKNKFSKIIFQHVYREDNKVADQLLNEVLDQKKYTQG